MGTERTSNAALVTRSPYAGFRLDLYPSPFVSDSIQDPSLDFAETAQICPNKSRLPSRLPRLPVYLLGALHHTLITTTIRRQITVLDPRDLLDSVVSRTGQLFRAT